MPTFEASVDLEFVSESLETAGTDLRRLQLVARDAGFLIRSGQVMLPADAVHTAPQPPAKTTALTGEVEELLWEAHRLAAARGHSFVGTEHVLLAMTQLSADAFARRLLDDVGATEELRSRIERAIG